MGDGAAVEGPWDLRRPRECVDDLAAHAAPLEALGAEAAHQTRGRAVGARVEAAVDLAVESVPPVALLAETAVRSVIAGRAFQEATVEVVGLAAAQNEQCGEQGVSGDLHLIDMAWKAANPAFKGFGKRVI